MAFAFIFFFNIKMDGNVSLAPGAKEIICRDASTNFDKQATEELQEFVDQYASPGPPTRQLSAISKLHDIFKDWCRGSPFHIFISGSYKMNVHTKEADIDVVFVTTACITRAQVFEGFASALEAADAVTAITSIPNARVPLICATVDEQEFDIMTCHLRVTELPPRDSMVSTYVWMNGLDEASILAFNGPRITTVVLAAMPKPRQFLLAVRFLRLWAKQRAIYSNKSGYLGGINIVLLVAYTALHNPRALASTLVSKSVALMAKWDFSARVPVVKFLDDATACPVWLRAYDLKSTEKDALSMLTPCFPRFNTMHAASDFSTKVLASEFVRAHTLLTSMEALQKMNYATLAAALPIAGTCARYLKVSVSVRLSRGGMAWQGFIESQTRFLLQYLSKEELAIASFRFIPIWVTRRTDTHCVREAFVAADDDRKIRTYVVKGDIHRAFRYFMHTHAHAGPLQPMGSSLSLAFVNAADVPFTELTQNMLNFEETAAVMYALPPPLPPPAAIRPRSSSESSGNAAVPIVVYGAPLRFKFQRPAARMPLLRIADAGTPSGQKSRFSADAISAIRVRRMPRLLLPRPPLVQSVLVRPRRVDGAVVSSFDVYIGQEWRKGGWNFSASETLRGAPEVGAYTERLHWIAAYRAFAVQKMKHDPDFQKLVHGLVGKKLGCWCVRPETCHASVLLSLIT